MVPTTELLKEWRTKCFSVIEAILFVQMIALLALILLQVLTRYVLQAAVPWTEEIARMLLVWLVMLGAAVATERSTHYLIVIFIEKFRGMARISVLIATNILGLIFLAVMVDAGIAYARANMHTVYISTQVSRGLIYLALPVGGAIMWLSLLLQSIEVWINRGNLSHLDRPTPPRV